MADKEKEERVERLELLLQRGECFLNLGLNGFLIAQDDDAIGRKSEFIHEGFGRACRPLFKFLFVFGTTGDSPQNESARVGQSRSWQQER